MRNRRCRTLLALVAATTLALTTGACAGGEKDEQGRRKIEVSLTSTALSSAPVLAAIVADTFGDHGLAVEWSELGGDSSKAIATVARGQAEFATAGTPTVLDSVTEGLPVNLILNVERPALTIAMRKEVAARVKRETGVTPDSPVKERIAALKGMKVGAHPAGATNYTLLYALLERNGLDPEKDLKLLPSDQKTVAQSLKAGKFDAAMWSAGPLETIVGKDAVRWIGTVDGDLAEFEDYLYMGGITSKKILESEPELVEKFVASIRDGAELVLKDSKATREAVKKKFFPTLDDTAFDMTWESAKRATVRDQGFTAEEFDYTLSVTKGVYDRDYSKLHFDQVVPKFARTG